MNASLLSVWVDLLKRRGLALFGIATVAVVPALVATTLIDVLGAGRAAAIINGRLVPSATDQRWDRLTASATIGSLDVRLDVSILLLLGWIVAIAFGVGLLVGRRPPWTRVLSCVWVCVLLGLLAVAGMFGSVLLAQVGTGDFALLVAVLVGLLCLYGLARLAIGIPVVVAEGLGPVEAMRRGVALTRGRAGLEGVVLVVACFLLSVGALTVVHHAGQGAKGELWVGVGSLVETVALIAAIAVQAAMLAAVYAALQQDHLEAVRGPARRRAVLGVALLLVVPTGVTSALILANPRQLPVATVATPTAGFSSMPLALTVLEDGSTATADSMQVGVCTDGRCASAGVVSLPCVDGAAPTPFDGGRTCSIEAPLDAADITRDGTLIALRRGNGQEARLVWCRVTPGEMCEWGGSSTLYKLPKLWESWSMAVAATPRGGLVAALLGPGKERGRGDLLLVMCARLDCPQPTVRGVLDVPMADVWQGGVVDVGVNRISGSLAVGYFDRTTGSLWVGGCDAACEDGPTLAEVDVELRPTTSLVDLDVAATSTGPAAIVTIDHESNGQVTAVIGIVACTDLSCTTTREDAPNERTSARFATDGAGTVFLVARDAFSHELALVDLRTGASTALAGEGEVAAADFGVDGRLRTLLHGPSGLALVTSEPGQAG